MRSTEHAAPARALSGAARLQQERQLRQAIDLLRDNQLDAAQPLLESLLRRSPAHPDALHFLGVLKHAGGHSEEAIGLIQRSLQALPRQPGAWNNLGNVLVESRRYDEAADAYRQCLVLAPEHIDALSNLAIIQRKRGELAESEALCRRALQSAPEFALAWYNLSLALLDQGRIDEGLTAHSRAIVLWPTHLQARDAVVKALVHLGRLEEAAKLYREWLTADPGNPVIQHHLAACTASAAPARASDDYVERTFDAFAATFDANLSALGYRAPHLVAELLTELLPAPARQFDIHDLGCGTGLCGPMVREWARDLSGCDLSSGMLAKAERRRVYDHLHHAELVAHLRAHPEAFDALVCADTLCYFGELGDALQAAAQAMRPGGHLVFTVEALDDHAPEEHRLQPHGRYAHRRAYLERVLAQAGLGVAAMRHETLRHEAGKPVGGWLAAARRGS